jgi:hypothetical protein
MSDNPRQDRRIDGYTAALGVFGSGIAVSAALGWLRGDRVPQHYAVRDLVLGAVATHKFARLLSKDAVTMPLRAPFTTYEEPAGSGEVNESPRKSHPSHTIGELVTCPFCLTPWVATAYVAALVLAPRLARTWAAAGSIIGASDTLQHAYARLETG